jgi:IS605 OrfB family transposase
MLGLEVSPIEKQTLLRTMEKFNEACNMVASEKRMSRFKLHKVVYRKIRATGLSSQMAIGVIAKVAAAMKTQSEPEFYFHGAIPYDQRNISLKGDVVSISTIDGRKKLKVRIGEFQQNKIFSGLVKSGMKLCYRKDIGKFFLAVVVDTEDKLSVSSGILGLDLGIVNIATDSEGRVYTDGKVEEIRTKFNELRGRLQSVGTKSAKRHLKKMSGKERRFKRDVNHNISKQIVAAAKGTSSMIAMEDLTGIRERTTVRQSQRDRHAKWAFYELRDFVEYKARLAGVPTTVVNPKNTSRGCPKCLWTEKANRKSRDLFQCRRCGYTAPADFVGALGIRREAAFSLPIVTPMEQPIAQVVAISQPSGGRS